ncbi:methionine ABC transporter ATP-binding protein [Ignatzschineria larvae DSM 13226]|uniref:Methionine ABC transporter ATP-binding protein n=1 Tax=Ignatzschineria larvae DSM 13226 TaxID=1111732 RepID=A0ABZ3C0H5_9GAMM|nr:methionine ABC transporter ATP-binding protein [Ignatzschineria larvae]
MIKIEQLTKSYLTPKGPKIALQNISLTIERGSIFGVIGHSGAGKSTLIRCLNLLEKPDSGAVIIDGTDITQLPAKALMHERRKMGMIFQHFNLLSSQTVFDNIAFPLRLEKMGASAIQKRVEDLLELVDIADHRNKYPSELSGGQKQRVGIARALANNPKVLLCDEATSALDPQTTQSILELLVDINQKLNLTIVLITHEMEVIRSICHRVAVIHDSQIIEEGPVEEVFLHPASDVTKEFIIDKTEQAQLIKYLERAPAQQHHLYQLSYIGNEAFEPHLSQIIKQSNIDLSILSGSISYIRDIPYGQMIVTINGDKDEVEEAITLFKAHKVLVTSLSPALTQIKLNPYS